MIGWGSLKQGSDSFKYNRSLLSKKKSSKERFREEVKGLPLNPDTGDANQLGAIIAERIKRNRFKELVGLCFVIVIGFSLIVGFIYFISDFPFSWKQPGKYSDKSKLYSVKLTKLNNDLELESEYFIRGSKACDTFLKNGYKHQNSESYYESGEQFRSALYNYDTLLREVYFYKSGDTIPNFPVIRDNEVHKITIINPEKTIRITFDFLDGKIIQGTYKEENLTK